jgi:hypothetical protein
MAPKYTNLFTGREIEKFHSGVCEISLSNGTTIDINKEEEENKESCTCSEKSNSKK